MASFNQLSQENTAKWSVSVSSSLFFHLYLDLKFKSFIIHRPMAYIEILISSTNTNTLITVIKMTYVRAIDYIPQAYSMTKHRLIYKLVYIAQGKIRSFDINQRIDYLNACLDSWETSSDNDMKINRQSLIHHKTFWIQCAENFLMK